MKERLVRLEQFAECVKEKIHDHENIVGSHVMAMERLIEVLGDIESDLRDIGVILENIG